MPPGSRLVQIGTVVGVFGLAGEVKAAAGDADDLRVGLEIIAGTQCLRVDGVRRHKSHVLTHFEGIDDVSAAQAIVGLKLYAKEEDLAPIAPGSFRDGDLVGLVVVDAQAGELGRVMVVHHYPAADMLELTDGLLVPMLSAYGVSVDLANRRVSTSLPEGFLDLR